MDTNDQAPRWQVERRIPVALIFAIFLQTLGVVYWGAKLEAKGDSNQERIGAMELVAKDQSKSIDDVSQRLTRIEERMSMQNQLLVDIKSDIRKGK